jgi:hypothetical protein
MDNGEQELPIIYDGGPEQLEGFAREQEAV